MLMQAKLKVRPCKACRTPFQKRTLMHAYCSHACGIADAEKMAAKRMAKAEREARVDLRMRKLAAKPRGWWLKRAQAAFNAYIRSRDAKLPCVSCLRHHDGAHDAGHYLTVGARPELRFDEKNVWRQCVPCNQHLHGNLILFRAELLRRIGPAEVDRLEGPHEAKKYGVADLQTIHDTYRAKTKALLP
jgi:hypothetical protein